MYILLTSHGDFCTGLLNSYEMVAGSNDKIKTIKLDDSGIGKFTSELRQMLDYLTADSQVLVLSDVKGGTPYNESYHFYLNNPEKVRLIAGMNLPMLIEAGLNLPFADTIDNLVNIAVNAGKGSITSAEPEGGEDTWEF